MESESHKAERRLSTNGNKEKKRQNRDEQPAHIRRSIETLREDDFSITLGEAPTSSTEGTQRQEETRPKERQLLEEEKYENKLLERRKHEEEEYQQKLLERRRDEEQQYQRRLLERQREEEEYQRQLCEKRRQEEEEHRKKRRREEHSSEEVVEDHSLDCLDCLDLSVEFPATPSKEP